MNDAHITKHTLTSLRGKEGQTDWERLKASDGNEGPIDPEDEFDWDSAEIIAPQAKKLVSLRIDPDILDFFKGEGKGYQTRINAVLRSYVEAKRRKP